MINGKTLRNTLLVIAALALAVFLIVSFGFFSVSGHQSPGRIEDGVYYYSRFNCGLAYTPGEGSKLLSLPWKFGKEDAPAAYTVGERSFTLSEDETQLLENGTDVLPAGLSCSGSFIYTAEDSLMVKLYDGAGHDAGSLCLTADHSLVLDGALDPLCAAGRWAYGVDARGTEARLYCIDLETGESWLIADDTGGVSFAATDGRWLYTYRMWGSGSTSCWEIACGADGVPESLVYVGEV